MNFVVLGVFLPLPLYLLVGGSLFPFWISVYWLCAFEHGAFIPLGFPQLLAYGFMLLFASRAVARVMSHLSVSGRLVWWFAEVLALIAISFLPIYGAGVACGGDVSGLWDFILPARPNATWFWPR